MSSTLLWVIPKCKDSIADQLGASIVKHDCRVATGPGPMVDAMFRSEAATNDEWLVGRSYLSQKSMAALRDPVSENDLSPDQDKEVELIAA